MSKSCEWFNSKVTVANDQRVKSKMTRNLLCLLFVLCDFCSRTLAASAYFSDNLVSSKERSEAVVEYFKDHEVTEKQARENLRGMTEKDFNRPAYCSNCTHEHRKYCHSQNLLKDHCCCNQSHKTGEFTDMTKLIDFSYERRASSERGAPRLSFHYNHYKTHWSLKRLILCKTSFVVYWVQRS